MRTRPLNKLLPYFITLIAFGFTGCSTTGMLPIENDIQTDQERIAETTENQSLYIIRPGDEIEILVWEQPSFNTLTTVSRMGTVAVPLVGEIMVVGLTQDELKRSLEVKLAEFIKGDINLTISVRNTDTMIVSVLGKVARPDNYPVVDQTSIFRLLSTAGGLTEDANMKKVKLYRQSMPNGYETLNLIEYLDSGQLDAPEITVRPGDIVFVPKNENAVHEMSDFLRDVIILFGIFRVFN